MSSPIPSKQPLRHAKQLLSGLVVFLIALPLCLGIALASGAPLFAGILGGIVGGLIVGPLSGSQVSVSGPSAALATVVLEEIGRLHSFETFLVGVFLSGAIQLLLGLARGGFVAPFIPTSVIKGLLAATGTLIILKQTPHLIGYDAIAFGDDGFCDLHGGNTFSEIIGAFSHVQVGALLVGLLSLFTLLFWDKIPGTKKIAMPAPLFVVLLSVGISTFLQQQGAPWAIASTHLVEVPQLHSWYDFQSMLHFPSLSSFLNPAVYQTAVLIALCGSLETLLNLEAADMLDPEKRTSPPNQELIAQGIGNMTLGLIGGIPITSAIIRSGANIQAGGRTKLSTIVHGVLLAASFLFLAKWLNKIPLSALAAILIVVGGKLAAPQVFQTMWKRGWHQFAPFLTTIIAIVLTNLLFGILIGLGVSLLFILHSNIKCPLKISYDKKGSQKRVRIELANQISFLNRSSLLATLDQLPHQTDLIIDARNTHYIDSDMCCLLQEYLTQTAPARGMKVALFGLEQHHLT